VPDIDTYQRTVDRLLNKEIGINRYFTYVVTKTVKEGNSPERLEQISATGNA
jgi:Lrp/AsnC family transcriptional regulator, regulator of ectoine-degradation genes